MAHNKAMQFLTGLNGSCVISISAAGPDAIRRTTGCGQVDSAAGPERFDLVWVERLVSMQLLDRVQAPVVVDFDDIHMARLAGRLRRAAVYCMCLALSSGS
jgi:hypothetical protein